jgi:hypothetical protein
MWSLGMVLHKLIYFRLPWKNDENMAELEKEIMGFQGCVPLVLVIIRTAGE